MPFSIRPFCHFPVQCSVTYKASSFLKLPLAYFLGFAALTTLLLLSNSPAYAEWVNIGDTDEFTMYIDRDMIRRRGNLVKMWNLNDYKNIQTGKMGKSYLSSIEQYEYDCAEEQLRLLALTDFSSKMGRGVVVAFGLDPTKWKPVLPGGAGQAKWKIACGKK